MNMPGMSQRWINVDLLTTEYRVVGRVLVGNTGLQGLLSDKTKSFLEIRQAQIAYLRQPTRVVSRYESTFIVKDHIYVACMELRDYAGIQPYAHHGYTSYQNYPLHISFAGFEMDCTVQWTGRFEMSSLLVDNIGRFMLVYDATLESALISGLAIETPTAMVNTNRIDLVSLAVPSESTGG